MLVLEVRLDCKMCSHLVGSVIDYQKVCDCNKEMKHMTHSDQPCLDADPYLHLVFT